MLINLLRKKGNVSGADKILILSLLGGVLFFILFFSLWHQYFTDTTVRYAPADTVAYVHFSLPKTKYNPAFEDLAGRALAAAGLADFDLINIKREIAFFGQSFNDQLVFSVIIRTDRPAKVKAELDARGRFYQVLDQNYILIPADQSLFDFFINNKKNHLAIKARKNFSWFNSLSLYLADDFVDNSAPEIPWLMLKELLADQAGEIFLNFQVKPIGLIAFVGSRPARIVRPPAEFDQFDFIFQADRLSGWLADFNLAFAAVAPAEQATWQNHQMNWRAKYWPLAPQMLDDLSEQPIYFRVWPAPENKKEFWGGYDFYLNLDSARPLFETEIKQLEYLLKHLAAPHFPRERTVILSDGTRIVEWVIDGEQFSVSSRGDFQALTLPDTDFNLFYQLTDENLIVTSDENSLFNQKDPVVNGNFVYLKIAHLPKNDLWFYFDNFEAIFASDQLIILK